jgi:hypothetical protein
MSDLTPGTRVVVRNSGHLSGLHGVVVEMKPTLLNGHDVAVQLDEPADLAGPSWLDNPLCFYSHELAVAK